MEQGAERQEEDGKFQLTPQEPHMCRAQLQALSCNLKLVAFLGLPTIVEKLRCDGCHSHTESDSQG